jgi:hypothetical protein
MKARPSKLDDFADKLREWFTPKEQGGEALTLAQARNRLSELNCSVSVSRLGDWWEAKRAELLQEKMLADIASGAQFNRQLEKQLAANAPPELLTLMKLIKTLIAQLAVNGAADQDTLKLVGQLSSLVLEHDKSRANYEIKKAELDLKERRVVLLEQKAALVDQAKQVVESKSSPAEQMQRLRQIFGMT